MKTKQSTVVLMKTRAVARRMKYKSTSYVVRLRDGIKSTRITATVYTDMAMYLPANKHENIANAISSRVHMILKEIPVCD